VSDRLMGTLVDGRYKVVGRLGTGGMAEVVLAEDQQLGRKVALKLLHPRFAEDPGFVERFRREAQAAAGLQHPNVVGVYDRGAWDDTYYIAMEYVPGRTLKQVISEEAPVEPVRAIHLVEEILKAVRFAHRRGVIHRDLKPHNVMVGDGDQAKVTDFGIARAGASDMTETGSILGTAQYLSPEQAQGLAVSPSSDLYSVGVILYELLTARVPFDAEAAVTVAIKHVSEAPVAPRTLNPLVPLPLEQVVRSSPGDRTMIDGITIRNIGSIHGSGTADMKGGVVAALHALRALRSIYRPGYTYNKVGVMLTELVPCTVHQPEIWAETCSSHERLIRALDHINASWGRETLRYGAAGITPTWQMRRDKNSGGYTTSWEDLPVAFTN